MQDAEGRGLREDALPVGGGEFGAALRHLERIGAIGTMQGAAMGDLRHQRHG